MNLDAFERNISEQLTFNDRDSKRMNRVISDLSQDTGMQKQEILEFLMYGAETELQALHNSYDWEFFRRTIEGKLKK